MHADRQRHQAQRRHHRRHQNRHQTLLGAAQDGVHGPGRTLDLDQMFIMVEQQDRITGADPEHRDQTDHRAHGQSLARQHNGEYRTDQAEGQIDQHQPAMHLPAKANEQDHADDHQRKGCVEQQLGLRGALLGGGAGEIQIDARRQLHRIGDPLLGVRHRRLLGAARHDECHRDITLSSVMLHLVPRRSRGDARHLRQPHRPERPTDHQ